MNDYSQFFNLSCYEEFHLKCEICGVNVVDVLKSMLNYIDNFGIEHRLIGKTQTHYFLWTNDGKVSVFDINGNKMKYDEVFLNVILKNQIPSNIKKCIIPDTTIRLWDNVFCNRTNLEYVKLNNCITCIDYCAFGSCSSLRTIEGIINVRNISESTFNGCTKLENITLSNSVKTIGNMAFAYCVSLKEIHIPDSVECIMDDVFFGCSKNLNIYVNMKNLKYVGSEAFYDCNVIDTSTI